MDKTMFAQSTARIRALENRMLDRVKLEALIESSNFQDALRILGDTRYGEYLNRTSHEEGLRIALEDLYREIRKISPVREIIDVFSIRYEGHNIKTLIKGKFSGVNKDNILIDTGITPLSSLKDMIKEENFRYMPKTLRAYVEKAFEIYKNSGDPQDIDIIIDRGMYQYMLETAAKSGMEYMVGIVKVMIDIVNIKSFIRIRLQDKDREFFKKIYIDGGRLDFDLFGSYMNDSLENFPNVLMHTQYFNWVREGIGDYLKSGNIGAIEKHGDNYIINYLKSSKFISFGPEPIVAFILSIENEIKILRIILTGKKNEVPPMSLRERLRDIYV